MLVLFENVFQGDDCTWSINFENFHGIFSSQEKMIEYLIEIKQEHSEEFYYVDVKLDEIVNVYRQGEELSFNLNKRNYFNRRKYD